MKPGAAKHVRCAIYTRVSTDQGLEQDFNSLDAQYDAPRLPSLKPQSLMAGAFPFLPALFDCLTLCSP
jgi:hypothetical protein